MLRHAVPTGSTPTAEFRVCRILAIRARSQSCTVMHLVTAVAAKVARHTITFRIAIAVVTFAFSVARALRNPWTSMSRHMCKSRCNRWGMVIALDEVIAMSNWRVLRGCIIAHITRNGGCRTEATTPEQEVHHDRSSGYSYCYLTVLVLRYFYPYGTTVKVLGYDEVVPVRVLVRSYIRSTSTTSYTFNKKKAFFPLPDPFAGLVNAAPLTDRARLSG